MDTFIFGERRWVHLGLDIIMLYRYVDTYVYTYTYETNGTYSTKCKFRIFFTLIGIFRSENLSTTSLKKNIEDRWYLKSFLRMFIYEIIYIYYIIRMTQQKRVSTFALVLYHSIFLGIKYRVHSTYIREMFDFYSLNQH